MKKIFLIIIMNINLIIAQNLEATVDSIFLKYCGNTPGVAIGIFNEGEIIFSKGYGKANLKGNISITDSTNFRLASVTKQFTAASILILTQEGKLTLNDKITNYFPCLKKYGSEITIKHLLTHTSGLLDYEDFVDENISSQLKDADVLAILCNQDSTYFSAGTNYRYSNSGFALLALIVEKVSGESFADFLYENIFSRLGMKNSLAFESGISDIKNRAYGYALLGDEIKFNDQSSTSAVLGDGGIYTSVKDMFLWDQSFYSDQILSDENRELSFTPQTNAEVEGVYYGFGWRIDSLMNYKRVYHTGSTCGFSNVFMRIPELHLSLVILMNQKDQPALMFGNKILAYLISEIFKK